MTAQLAFSLVLSNPTTYAANVSLLLSLPLGSSSNTDRPLYAGPNAPLGPDPRKQVLAVLNNTAVSVCIDACASNNDCTWWRHSGSGSPGIPPVTKPNNDCPGNDMYPRYITSNLDECTAICGTVAGCNGVVFDTILSEQQGQCNNTAGSGKFCCLLKSQCTSYSPKSGDTAWAAGVPSTPAGQCTLLRLAPAVEQFIPPSANASVIGPRNGIKGYFSSSLNGAGLTLSRSSTFDSDPLALWQDPAAAVADFTLLGADAFAGDASVSVSSTANNDLGAIWSDFAADGRLSGLPAGGPVMAGHGAIAASTVLQPDETRALTLVFSWYLPHRLYVGQDLGNQYATRYNSSVEVAASVGGRLSELVADGAAWNQAATNNTLPDWYRDFLVNSLATQVKMGVWVAKNSSGDVIPGGRYRQFEAFSNCDLDPVHVSSYHAIPYATFWPDLAANTIATGWAQAQDANSGMVKEFLGDFSAPGGRLTGQMDVSAGGRQMSDVSTVFILYSLLAFQNSGDAEWLSRIYPSLVRAAEWQIARGLVGPVSPFPAYLQNTYDYLGLDAYPYQAYTGFLHLAAMRAIREIAAAVGDANSTIVSLAQTSEAGVAQAMASHLWTNRSFWRAWQTVNGDAPDVPMSGTLHGQSWAWMLGLGSLVNGTALLASHIQAELSVNCAYNGSDGSHCPLGLLTLPGTPSQAGWALDASPAQSMETTANLAWLQGSDALDGSSAQAVTELYRSRLADLWNWHDLHVGPNGLACNGAQLSGPALAGTPFVNAHYARQLQGWAIQRAVVGQTWNAHTRTLVLSPASLRPGERLPFFTSQAAGVLIRQESRHDDSDTGNGATAEASSGSCEQRLCEVATGELSIEVFAGAFFSGTEVRVRLSPSALARPELSACARACGPMVELSFSPENGERLSAATCGFLCD